MFDGNKKLLKFRKQYLKIIQVKIYNKKKSLNCSPSFFIYTD
jgi:hypothetical protein